MDSLLGITFRDWMWLLKENHFAIDPPYWRKAAILTLRSISNSKYAKKEKKIYDQILAKIKLQHPPLFIIGHWRSGTTLLHNIMVQDQQFAYPNLFQVSNPHTFLTLEDVIAEQLQKQSAEKRPMDNIVVDYQSAGEDEFALSISCMRSPIIAWAFPRHEKKYDKYLTFEGVSSDELKRWQNALVTFMKKLTLKYKRPLILKSPVHTARLQILHNLFPEARFIHIHRNPYDVFKSTLKLYDTAVSLSYLHKPNQKALVDGILRRYRRMYDAYFEQKEKIPKSQFFEIAYEDLIQDTYGKIEQIYQDLALPGFENFKPKLNEYLAGISDYKKNKYKPLPDADKKRVARTWRRSFEAWGYEI